MLLLNYSVDLQRNRPLSAHSHESHEINIYIEQEATACNQIHNLVT